jgi:chromosome segregation ATPase
MVGQAALTKLEQTRATWRKDKMPTTIVTTTEPEAETEPKPEALQQAQQFGEMTAEFRALSEKLAETENRLLLMEASRTGDQQEMARLQQETEHLRARLLEMESEDEGDEADELQEVETVQPPPQETPAQPEAPPEKTTPRWIRWLLD